MGDLRRDKRLMGGSVMENYRVRLDFEVETRADAEALRRLALDACPEAAAGDIEKPERSGELPDGVDEEEN